MKAQSVGWKFFLWWLVANILGPILVSPLGLCVALLASQGVGISGEFFLVTLGISVTLGQWILLRRYLALSKLWILTGATLVVSGLVPASEPGISFVQALLAITVLGVSQALLLRPLVKSSWVWLAATFAALAVIALFIALARLMSESEIAAYLALSGLAAYPIFTGLALLRLLPMRAEAKTKSYAPRSK